VEPTSRGPELVTGTTIRSVEDLGALIQRVRKEQGLTQIDISGLAHTGNRYIVDLEKGKPTIQMQKALDVLELLGLELIVRKRGLK
jgi:HTH-type transcriptional regulator/antitoxin HipB